MSAPIPPLSAAQDRLMREAAEHCVVEPRGSRVAMCDRLVALGLLRRASAPRTYHVTTPGLVWVDNRAPVTGGAS